MVSKSVGLLIVWSFDQLNRLHILLDREEAQTRRAAGIGLNSRIFLRISDCLRPHLPALSHAQACGKLTAREAGLLEINDTQGHVECTSGVVSKCTYCEVRKLALLIL